jgi:hypothetical protein
MSVWAWLRKKKRAEMPRRKYGEDSFYNHCRSKTPEEAREKWAVEERKQFEADRLRVERHQPVVTRVEDDGEGLVVEFTRDNGERVKAGYVMSSWHRPPADVLEEMMKALAHAPDTADWDADTPKDREKRSKPKS